MNEILFYRILLYSWLLIASVIFCILFFFSAPYGRHSRSGWGFIIKPRVGLFRWISCPNYFGEILEWAGWALAAWSLAGFSFAVGSLANLLPRALTHHKWYKSHFSDYPEERKAFIPGIL